MVVKLSMEANHKEVKMKTLFRLTLSTWFKTLGSLMPGGSLSAYFKHNTMREKCPGIIQSLVYNGA